MPGNNYGLLTGPPGSLKTAVINKALAPLKQVSKELWMTYEQAPASRGLNLARAIASQQELQQRIKEAGKNPPKALLAKLDKIASELAGLKAEPPPCRELYFTDATVEKAQVLIQNNPNGLLMHRDELSGWLAKMDAPGHENDRAFYLEMHNGLGQSAVHRITRETTRCNAILSIIGGITPDGLQRHVARAYSGGENDGLLQRFQLATYPDMPVWEYRDEPDNAKAGEKVLEVFRMLDKYEASKDIDRDAANDNLPFLRFSPDAQIIYKAWRIRLQERLDKDGLHPVIHSHLAKFPRLMPALSLIFYVADQLAAKQPVIMIGAKSAERAVAWCDQLEKHAERIYGGLASPDEMAGQAIAKRILEGKLRDGFTPRDIYRAQWSGLAETKIVEAGLLLLEQAGWLQSEQVSYGGQGRPAARKYLINPQIFIRFDQDGKRKKGSRTRLAERMQEAGDNS